MSAALVDCRAHRRRNELAWKRVHVPTFKKKGKTRDAFRADNGPDKAHPHAVVVDGMRVKLPLIGWVKMREPVRFAGQIRSVTISRHADAWFASFGIEVAHDVPTRVDDGVVGVDLGLTALATLDDGTKITAPKPLRRYLRKLARLNRALALEPKALAMGTTSSRNRRRRSRKICLCSSQWQVRLSAE